MQEKYNVIVNFILFLTRKILLCTIWRCLIPPKQDMWLKRCTRDFISLLAVLTKIKGHLLYLQTSTLCSSLRYRPPVPEYSPLTWRDSSSLKYSSCTTSRSQIESPISLSCSIGNVSYAAHNLQVIFIRC